MLPVDRDSGVLPVDGDSRCVTCILDSGVLPVYWTQVCCL